MIYNNNNKSFGELCDQLKFNKISKLVKNSNKTNLVGKLNYQ